jgi:hypothetical protein
MPLVSRGILEAATKPGRRRTLDWAASVVFALISILPLLCFAYSLHTLGAIDRLAYQLALLLALGVAVLGFCLFRILMGRISEVLRVVQHAAQRTESPTSGRTDGAAQEVETVPGFGAIEEIQQLGDLADRLWKHEAEAYRGRDVSVLVQNSDEPMTGHLVDVSDSGFVLATGDGREVAVSYRRLMAMEAAAGVV